MVRGSSENFRKVFFLFFLCRFEHLADFCELDGVIGSFAECNRSQTNTGTKGHLCVVLSSLINLVSDSEAHPGLTCFIDIHLVLQHIADIEQVQKRLAVLLRRSRLFQLTDIGVDVGEAVNL